MRNMKKNYLLSAAAAFLLAVTGCSDDIENGGNSGGEDDGGKVYMTVNVSTVSKGALTKAGGTPSNPNNDGAGWGGTATVSWKSSMALMRVRCMMLISSW